MTEAAIRFAPWTAEPAYVGAAMLMAQRQVMEAMIAAQLRMIEDITRAMAAAQRDVLDAMVLAAARRG